MARMLSPIVKQSRREGYALHPKAHKVLVKRPQIPGQHGGKRTSKPSQFATQMREKQKVKRLYGLLERQFAKLMKEAFKSRTQSGAQVLEYLERRLDNAVYRAGFATSRTSARQLVNHGHFMLNDIRVKVPSARVSPKDKVSVRTQSKKNSYFKNLGDVSPPPSVKPSWLKVDRKNLTIEVTGVPTREEVEPDINEQLIVEYYSR